MCGSRNFCQVRGVQARRPENSLDDVFFFISPQLILKFTEGVQWFYYIENYPGGATFSRGRGEVCGPNDNIYKNPYNLRVSRGSGTPIYPLWIRTWSHHQITLPHYMCKLPDILILPWICHNGILCSFFFVTSRDIGYLENIWGYLPVHIRVTCLFTSRNIVTSPSPSPLNKPQASTIHGYFLSATPLTVIRLLLIYCLMLLPFVYSPSLVLALLCIPLCPL